MYGADFNELYGAMNTYPASTLDHECDVSVRKSHTICEVTLDRDIQGRSLRERSGVEE